VGCEEKIKFPKTKPAWAEGSKKKEKKKVNESSPPSLAQGQRGTKKSTSIDASSIHVPPDWVA
jgi:hypothetical protein